MSDETKCPECGGPLNWKRVYQSWNLLENAFHRQLSAANERNAELQADNARLREALKAISIHSDDSDTRLWAGVALSNSTRGAAEKGRKRNDMNEYLRAKKAKGGE
jgi:hypothetical protein